MTNKMNSPKSSPLSLAAAVSTVLAATPVVADSQYTQSFEAQFDTTPAELVEDVLDKSPDVDGLIEAGGEIFTTGTLHQSECGSNPNSDPAIDARFVATEGTEACHLREQMQQNPIIQGLMNAAVITFCHDPKRSKAVDRLEDSIKVIEDIIGESAVAAELAKFVRAVPFGISDAEPEPSDVPTEIRGNVSWVQECKAMADDEDDFNDAVEEAVELAREYIEDNAAQ